MLQLDPNLDKLHQWRVHQNIVLTLFIHSWYQYTEEERKGLPVTLHIGKEGGRSRIKGQSGVTLCEYSIYDSQPYVHWFRSLEDFDLIDELGQGHESNREDVNHGDDGGAETEKGV